MKILKKFACLFLCVAVLSTLFAFSVSADTGRMSGVSKKNSGNIVTDFSLTWSNNAKNGWVWWSTKTTYQGQASTTWLGDSPFYADSIVHNNIIKCDKIGGSFSVTASGDPSLGITVTSDSTSTTYSYSDTDIWDLTVDFEYSTSVSGFLRQSQDFKSTGTVKLGSRFYATDTGW